MKRTALITTVGLICLLSFPQVNAQEKKAEKRIKIIMEDKSGKQVMIDTTFTDNQVDSIKLKNGEVIHLYRDPDDKEEMIVSYNDKNVPPPPSHSTGRHTEVNKSFTITVDSPDSTDDVAVATEKGKHVYTYSISSDGNDRTEKRYNVIADLEKGNKQSGKRYVYINEAGPGSHPGGEKFDVYTDVDIASGDLDNTRYVVSKNGITVTVEGKDDAKIQEIVKEVQKKLGIDSSEKGMKTITKEPDTKVIKKK